MLDAGKRSLSRILGQRPETMKKMLDAGCSMLDAGKRL
jgi:hypothetical protein